MTADIHQGEAGDRELIKRAQAGDGQAMEEMTLRHDPLVKYVARRFRDRGGEMEDLLQIGRLGLVKAIRHFDLRYDVRFSTYAVPIVMGEIRRFLRDNGAVHISRTVRENGVRIQKLLEKEGESLPVATIAQRLGISAEDVILALESGKAVRSLDEPVSPGGEVLLRDTIGEDEQEKWMEKMELSRLLDSLLPEERSLIARRYFAEETQARIARDRGMTQVQVSRMESRVLKRLREAAKGRDFT